MLAPPSCSSVELVRRTQTPTLAVVTQQSTLQRDRFLMRHVARRQVFQSLFQPKFLGGYFARTQGTRTTKTVELATTTDELSHIREELVINRILRHQLLPIASRSSNMRQALLLRSSDLCEVPAVTIRDQRACEIGTQNVTRDFPFACRGELEMNELLVAMHPVVRSFTVERSVGLIRMNRTITAGDFLYDISNDGLGQLRQHDFKSNQRGRSKSDAEQFFDRSWNLAVSDADYVPQVDRFGE